MQEWTEWRLSCANGHYVADNLQLLFFRRGVPGDRATVTLQVVTIGLETCAFSAKHHPLAVAGSENQNTDPCPVWLVTPIVPP
jgi:hypothetical protein